MFRERERAKWLINYEICLFDFVSGDYPNSSIGELNSLFVGWTDLLCLRSLNVLLQQKFARRIETRGVSIQQAWANFKVTNETFV